MQTRPLTSKKAAEVYFNPGRVEVSWEIVVELAKAGISLRREPDEPWTAREKSGLEGRSAMPRQYPALSVEKEAPRHRRVRAASSPTRPGCCSSMIRQARPTLTEVPLADLSLRRSCSCAIVVVRSSFLQDTGEPLLQAQCQPDALLDREQLDPLTLKLLQAIHAATGARAMARNL